MIYLDKRPVPQDLELVHKMRKTMFDATTRKDLLIGLLEFADSFGANTVGSTTSSTSSTRSWQT